jgi:hypothetical protein
MKCPFKVPKSESHLSVLQITCRVATNSKFISLLCCKSQFWEAYTTWGTSPARYDNNLFAASKLLPRHLPSLCSSVDCFLPTFLFTSHCRSLFLSYRKTSPYTIFFDDVLPIFSQRSVGHVLQSSTTNHRDPLRVFVARRF